MTPREFARQMAIRSERKLLQGMVRYSLKRRHYRVAKLWLDDLEALEARAAQQETP